jgi:CRISPR-associated protein Cst1
MLQYTGHPFVDVGIAAITAYAQKRDPTEVTQEDLEKISAYIEQNYTRPPLRGYLTMAFTSNAWFIQDAYNPDKPGLSSEQRTARANTRNDWASRHVRQWQDTRTKSETEVCIFTGQPAVATTLSGKLPESRAGRAQVPLLQGDDAINFFAYGNSGLPISGVALLALQFFPVGCAKCGVGLLAVHSDNNRLTYEITREFLMQNVSDVAKAQVAGEDKLPGSKRSLKTLLIETLSAVERRRHRADQVEEPASLTAYNFNNGKTPSLDLYHLPLEIVTFLQTVATSTYREAWNQVVQRSWQLTQAKQSSRKKQAATAQEPSRNYLYEDLFSLPSEARRFIRTYFLRVPQHTRFEDDPRRNYSLRDEMHLVSWALVELFLRKVVHMDEDRVKRICALGDGLALYVRTQGGGGKRFFRNFFTENKPAIFRALLIRANIAHVKAGYEPLFDVHTYIDVFEEGDEIMRPDWRLARDLVLMRMIDQLRDWLNQNPDATPDTTIENESAATENPAQS